MAFIINLFGLEGTIFNRAYAACSSLQGEKRDTPIKIDTVVDTVFNGVVRNACFSRLLKRVCQKTGIYDHVHTIATEARLFYKIRENEGLSGGPAYEAYKDHLLLAPLAFHLTSNDDERTLIVKGLRSIPIRTWEKLVKQIPMESLIEIFADALKTTDFSLPLDQRIAQIASCITWLTLPTKDTLIQGSMPGRLLPATKDKPLIQFQDTPLERSILDGEIEYSLVLRVAQILRRSCELHNPEDSLPRAQLISRVESTRLAYLEAVYQQLDRKSEAEIAKRIQEEWEMLRIASFAEDELKWSSLKTHCPLLWERIDSLGLIPFLKKYPTQVRRFIQNTIHEEIPPLLAPLAFRLTLDGDERKILLTIKGLRSVSIRTWEKLVKQIPMEPLIEIFVDAAKTDDSSLPQDQRIAQIASCITWLTLPTENKLIQGSMPKRLLPNETPNNPSLIQFQDTPLERSILNGEIDSSLIFKITRALYRFYELSEPTDTASQAWLMMRIKSARFAHLERVYQQSSRNSEDEIAKKIEDEWEILRNEATKIVGQ